MKTFSQIKSNVGVPIKKKVCAFCIYSVIISKFGVYCASSLFSKLHKFFFFPLFFSFLLSLSHPSPQPSVHLLSRWKRTKKKSDWRDGCSKNSIRYLWTQTLSTTAWPMTWPTVCSVRESPTTAAHRSGNGFVTFLKTVLYHSIIYFYFFIFYRLYCFMCNAYYWIIIIVSSLKGGRSILLEQTHDSRSHWPSGNSLEAH